ARQHPARAQRRRRHRQALRGSEITGLRPASYIRCKGVRTEAMSQQSLLVVDDEIGVRESIRLIFNKSLRLHEARSGQEALQKVKEETPDVILLDIMMPGSDGLETLKKIKEIHPDGQVIMLTALNTARTAFTAKETGAFDYVTKPFDVDELRLRV